MKLKSRFKLWRWRRLRQHYLVKIDKEFRDLRKLEALGLYYEGVTEDLVGVLNEEMNLDIEVPTAPHIHWWDRFLVSVSAVQVMLDRDNYIGILCQYIGLCGRGIKVCDRAIADLNNSQVM